MAHPIAGELTSTAADRASRLRSLQRAAILRAGSMTALLIMLILAIFVIPVVFAAGESQRVAGDLSFTVLMVAGAAAVFEHRAISFAATAMCALAALIRWSEWVLPASVSPLAREVSALMALVLMMAIVGARVFAGGGSVTADRIVGAVALYLLLAFGWAAAYELTAMHVPDAFAGGVPSGRGPERWVYFSLVTLTTVGYGDITPVARVARSLAALEALVGQLYPAIILARLVSLHGASNKGDGA